MTQELTCAIITSRRRRSEILLEMSNRITAEDFPPSGMEP